MATQLLIVRTPAGRSNAIARLASLDLSLPWEVALRPYKSKRSTEQNARYWAVLQAAAHETGYAADELHELAKARFLGTDRIELADQVIERPRSTTKLSTSDFATYCQHTEAWLVAELGLRLPAWGVNEFPPPHE